MSLVLDITLVRPGFRLALQAELPSGGVTAISGRSGCGKTSLLRCIAGLEPSARGRIVCAGRTWLDDAACLRLPPEARGIGYVIQEGALLPHRDVRGNLLYAWTRVPAARRRLALDEIAIATGIVDLLPRRIAGLSGGERQRVALARALLACPEILLLDEPFAALDVAARAGLMDLVGELVQRFALPTLLVSHDLAEVARLADRMLVLEGGALHAQGPVRELLSDLERERFPGEEVFGVLDGALVAWDAADHLATLRCAGAMLHVPLAAAPAPGRHRLAVRAGDISLCREAPQRTSILNVLPVRIDSWRPVGPGRCLVRCLLDDGTPILVAITERSRRRLELAPGLACHAQVKALALL